MTPKDDKNIHVELTTDPPVPLAGFKTLMFFKLTPNKNVEMYIGAWAHMLAASSDEIDLILCASVSCDRSRRRRLQANPVQCDLSTRGDLSSVGEFPTRRRRQHSGLQRYREESRVISG
jgi:hypothetical protein